MRTFLKWAGIVVAGLAAIVAIAVAAIYVISNREINRTYAVPAVSVTLPTDSATIAYGERLSSVFGCHDCHGENLGGGPVIEEPAFATLYAPNLTSGRGGVGGTFTDADYVRAIRFGVSPDGKSLWIMPSAEYYNLSDADVGAIVAYLRALPPVDQAFPSHHAGPIARMLVATGQLHGVFQAPMIDPAAPRPDPAPPGATVAFGRYVGSLCKGCHGADYAGGPVAGAPPDAPLAMNLTPAGELGGWTREQFIATIRTGVNPNGHRLDPDWMPVKALRHWNDDELTGLWMFLRTLPPARTRGRD